MINFSLVQSFSIPEGAVSQITDSFGNILWIGDKWKNILQDFEYTLSNGNPTLVAWKETLNGISSTELVIPDYSEITL